ncbi:MAG: DUF302 domain-containing protein [Ignavibacteria bacterium]|nr:DUF302 domain-containing protein [Ignavibacteria bacterium]
MEIHFDKTLTGTGFDDAVLKVTEELKKEGFGVLTEIDVKDTLKKKIDADISNYRILGACNPAFAHKAILAENKIGVFLPCNVIVRETDNGDIEISAVDPVASMSAVENESLGSLANEVRDKLMKVIEQV